MTDYAGNPASYPATLPLLSDGTPPAAVQTNVPLEALADRTENLRTHTPRVRTQDVTTLDDNLSVWTAPARCFAVTLEGWGGGGGGGGGASTGTPVSGGGGGGGAMRRVVTVPVTPGTAYDVHIGRGGSGGAINTATTDATNGGKDTVFSEHGGAELARFSGAGPGTRGVGTMSLVANHEQLALGGTSAKGQIATPYMYPTHSYITRGPGCGGEGIGNEQFGGSNHVNLTRPGSTSLEGYAGGAGGDATGAQPAGGGGAGGPGGVGGAGGDGGVGATPAGPGQDGGYFTNTGAGGGGGGGCATGGGGIGAGGGDGGGGFLRIIWTEDSP